MLIGTDIGTSGTKTVLFDLNGNAVASDTQEYPLYQPQNGWAEQDPQDWWNAVAVSIKNVIAKSGVNASEIKGIGLSGQMHGLVMLDKDDKVLRRSIIWCDQRTQKECDEITSVVGKEKLIEITANPALTGFTASKLRWVMNNEPDVFAKCTKVMLPKDYIRYMLTGEFATEVSDASGMQFMDIKNRCWSKELLDILGIDIGLLPKMYESYEISGKVNKYASELTGLCVGTPVAGGAGDQAACAVGNGIVKSGVVSSTIGTSGVVFAHAEKPAIDPLGRVHTFCHAVPGAWHMMGVTQAAGLSLKWFRDNFCAEEMAEAEKQGIDPYIIMDKMAEDTGISAHNLIYLPYLMGERTPHLDADCRGVFFGLSAIHTKADMIRAILEGVCYSLTDCMDIIREMGVDASAVRVSGGGGKSPLWRQMQADMFDCGVQVLSSSEGGALGVALLAGVGTGVWSSVPEACDATIKVKKTYDPIADNAKVYAKNHVLYKQLYTSLKDCFKMI
ncbi:MAG: xylulokinase [Ruminococcaceae bacterium]|nr:xylulokinase [Oscillospiraceae bacterium]